MIYGSIYYVLIAFIILVAGNVSAQKYCGTISAGETNGATGFVALEIANGQANYAFQLDLTNFQTTSCPDINLGIKYHVHIAWTNTSATSTANSLCSTAGGHYDPNFACSNYSSAIKTDCVDIGRTWGQGYRYACNTTNYQAGHYSLCEVGDTSSKYGTLYPENNIVSLAQFTDYQPPYAVNYNSADLDSTAWLSFVFHCAQNSNRLVCVKFSDKDLSACNAAFNSFVVSSDDDSVTQTKFETAVAISTIVCTIGGIIIGFAICWFCFGRKSEESSALNKV